MEEGKDVSVSVKLNYIEDSLRPDSFEVFYKIDGMDFFESITKSLGVNIHDI